MAHVKRTSLARQPCSIARTMDLLGDWWTPLVLRDAFHGIRRFDDFRRSLGVARNTLALRLQRLVDEGLLERVRYQDRPERFEYVLTDKGADFYPVLAAITAWGDRWLAGAEGAPVITRHTSCGHATHAEVVCEHCHQPLTGNTVHREMGPGFPEGLADRPDVRARFANDDPPHPAG